MQLAIARTLPLRRLLSRIGSSTYRFNTILVGLDCIAKGGGDGGSIAVSWGKPKNPAQAKNTAAQARSFACAGAIVMAADVFDSYLRDIADEVWLGFSPNTVDIATRAKTRPGDQGGAYSVAERAAAIADDLDITSMTSIALVDLFSKWRNVVAHRADRVPKLDPAMRQELIKQRLQIERDYAHLRVELAIKNFEARAVPVPKEVTSLVTNAVRLARLIDECAIRRVAANHDQIELITESLIKDFFRNRELGAARAFVADTWQGDMDRRLAALVKLLGTMGVTDSSEPISAPLRQSFLSELARLPRDEFEAKFVPS